MKVKARIYSGRDLAISYDVGRCIHAAECVARLPSVFDPERRPWIDPEGAGADEIAATIEACPTGALTYRRLDGGKPEAAPTENRMTVAPDGPLVAHGRISLQLADGDLQPHRAALCRCGDSNNKPFCDNSHVECAFRDSGELGEGGIRGEAEPGAPLEIRPAANGPLLVAGSLELVSGDGESHRRGSKAALCRCGASQNKPFCDGSHVAAGFRSERSD